jgi:hypothetical protein
MRYNLFHNGKFLLSYDLRFEINMDDSIFYNNGKDLKKSHSFKDIELCVKRVVN